MRTACALLSLASLLFVTVERAGADRAAALRIIDQAIQAHGGKDRLARLGLVEMSGAGKMFLFGKQSDFTSERTWNFPGRFRESVGLTADDGNKIPTILVINGKQAWRQISGETQELDGDSLRDVLDELHVLRLSTLTPLKEDEFTLDTLPEAKVNGRPALVVKASAKGNPPCSLYFDKATNLLVKIERKGKSLGLDFVRALHFSNHKPFEGVVLPTRLEETLNGNKVIELNVSRYRMPRLLEGKPFEKP